MRSVSPEQLEGINQLFRNAVRRRWRNKTRSAETATQ